MSMGKQKSKQKRNIISQKMATQGLWLTARFPLSMSGRFSYWARYRGHLLFPQCEPISMKGIIRNG